MNFAKIFHVPSKFKLLLPYWDLGIFWLFAIISKAYHGWTNCVMSKIYSEKSGLVGLLANMGGWWIINLARRMGERCGIQIGAAVTRRAVVIHGDTCYIFGRNFNLSNIGWNGFWCSWISLAIFCRWWWWINCVMDDIAEKEPTDAEMNSSPV